MDTLEVKAYHPHWIGMIRLSRSSDRAYHVPHKTIGSYSLNGEILTIDWGEVGTDVFTQRENGEFVHKDYNSNSITFLDRVYIESRPYKINNVGVLLDESSYEVYVRLRTSDVPTFVQVFVNREYESPDLPTTADTIVDLGANVGFATVFFGLRYVNATILSVEPEPGNFIALERNTQGLGARIQREQAAIWYEDGLINLHTEAEDGSPLGEWGAQVSTALSGNSKLTHCYRFDTLCTKYRFDKIDILKIDIEGAEVELFSSDPSGWLSRVHFIIVETHDRFRPGSEQITRRCLQDSFEELPRVGENLMFRRKRTKY